MGEHACKTCSDTHRMPAPENVGGEWPCTRCPTPCRSCACNGGRGAYCATTPCGCACHVARGAANLGNQEALLSRLRAAEERVRILTTALQAVEWQGRAGWDGHAGYASCPACEGIEPGYGDVRGHTTGHEPKCIVAAALDAAKVKP